MARAGLGSLLTYVRSTRLPASAHTPSRINALGLSSNLGVSDEMLIEPSLRVVVGANSMWLSCNQLRSIALSRAQSRSVPSSFPFLRRSNFQRSVFHPETYGVGVDERRPVRISGRLFYVLILHPHQHRSLG